MRMGFVPCYGFTLVPCASDHVPGDLRFLPSFIGRCVVVSCEYGRFFETSLSPIALRRTNFPPVTFLIFDSTDFDNPIMPSGLFFSPAPDWSLENGFGASCASMFDFFGRVIMIRRYVLFQDGLQRGYLSGYSSLWGNLTSSGYSLSGVPVCPSYGS